MNGHLMTWAVRTPADFGWLFSYAAGRIWTPGLTCSNLLSWCAKHLDLQTVASIVNITLENTATCKVMTIQFLLSPSISSLFYSPYQLQNGSLPSCQYQLLPQDTVVIYPLPLGQNPCRQSFQRSCKILQIKFGEHLWKVRCERRPLHEK